MSTCLGGELFIQFTEHVFCKRLSMCVCPLSFGFENTRWDVGFYCIIPDRCLFFHMTKCHIVGDHMMCMKFYFTTIELAWQWD